MTARRPGRERGSASIWVLSCCVLLLVVAAVVTIRALAVLARHRAESAADLAALAAAGQIGSGTGAGEECAAAVSVARANHAQVGSCTVTLAADGRTGTVVVRVHETADLPVVGARSVSASARAGRVPP